MSKLDDALLTYSRSRLDHHLDRLDINQAQKAHVVTKIDIKILMLEIYGEAFRKYSETHNPLDLGEVFRKKVDEL